ncbi:uncharacterized protein GLRG_05746 [Colletotrichum graminicola M1.001]|uniref:Uncharacterized protein n=1 Tax=Colletotrichum graminicola (strain M1.001 / M2 / FGSC 10212) TaxID=645133 RepID=E3QIJ2_COLGM|nr:uncharacterized protein GLRG_05746 [Colletotrichum graminicola M1.001]EFQ30602.1 hypothetical protein GLRG_05746 [Colletotrichum graminicola M1.001]
MSNPKDNNLPVQPDELQEHNSLQPLTYIDVASEHSTSVTTPAGDGAPPESSAFVKDDALRTQEPETANDCNYGNIPSEMSSSLARGRAWYSDAQSQSSPEATGNQSGFTRSQTADNHRKSKTEFNSIPDEVVPVGLDMARSPGTGSQAHRKSSTEFGKIVAPGKSSPLHALTLSSTLILSPDAGLAKQPHVQDQAAALPPVVPKPHSAPGEKQDNGGRKADSQLWQKPEAQGSSQQLWR